MKYGCARVSTDDQSQALQLAELKKAGWCQGRCRGEQGFGLVFLKEIAGSTL